MQARNLVHSVGLSPKLCEESGTLRSQFASRISLVDQGVVGPSSNLSIYDVECSTARSLSESLVEKSAQGPWLHSRVKPGAAVGICSRGSLRSRRRRRPAMSISNHADMVSCASANTEAGLPAVQEANLLLEVAPEGFQGAAMNPPEESTDYVHADGRSSYVGGQSMQLVVVGHRGCGKNKTLPLGETPEGRPSIRENTIISFNLAANSGAQFVEFDVQVTGDGVPIIFHDDWIIADDKVPRHIGDLTVEEFLAMGPQRGANKEGRPLYRKAPDGSVALWTANVEDSMCTLAEAFAEVQPTVGFNIELKFDDDGETSDAELHRVIDAVLEDVSQYANGRMIFFSSFHPDAVQILRKEQSAYPVFFLTDGGGHVYRDARRNSIEAAIQVCKQGGLQGIVSEVKAVLQNPAAVAPVKAEGLWLFTYGELNNVAEAVCKQQEWGVDGVIVDHVLEMVRVARQMQQPASPSRIAVGTRKVSVA